MKRSANDPIGRNTLNTTAMQDDGNESAHLPKTRDNSNGLLVDASHEVKSGQLGYARLPNEGSYNKQRALRTFEAKRKLKL